MKEFVFVEFADGSSDVVYKKWMEGKSFCYWPPSNKNVQNLVKQKADVKDNWKKFSCTIKCHASKPIVNTSF